MESQKEAILMTLVGVAKSHNKKYCWVSQNKQLDLLSKFHSWNISRRTLNRRLKELVEEGYIIRIRRLIKGSDGKPKFNSTLYKFTAKLFMWLKRLGDCVLRLFSFYRVPKWAHYKSKRQNEISAGASVFVDILWKSDLKGRASPS